MSSADRHSVLLPLKLIWMPYFSCLLALAGPSSTVLNRSEENGRPGLISDLKEKAFSLSPLNRIFIGFFINALYQFEEVLFSPSPLSACISKGSCILSNTFFFLRLSRWFDCFWPFLYSPLDVKPTSFLGWIPLGTIIFTCWWTGFASISLKDVSLYS